jgi:hypothetical protein
MLSCSFRPHFGCFFGTVWQSLFARAIRKHSADNAVVPRETGSLRRVASKCSFRIFCRHSSAVPRSPDPDSPGPGCPPTPRVRPTPAATAPPPLVDVRDWPAAADSGLWGEPARDGHARDAEDATESAQAGPLLISPQNGRALGGGVGLRTGSLAAPATAVATHVTPATIRGAAVADDGLTLTMRTGNSDGDHERLLSPSP